MYFEKARRIFGGFFLFALPERIRNRRILVMLYEAHFSLLIFLTYNEDTIFINCSSCLRLFGPDN
jgi:hypothetical protein